MSQGYHSPGPAWGGFDGGQVGDNRAAQVEAARKTPVGVTEHGDTVFQLDEPVQYWAVEEELNQYGSWDGTVRTETLLPVGTLVVREKGWATLRWPTTWSDFATSAERRAGERGGTIASHQLTQPGVLWPEPISDDRREGERRQIEAAIAARWVIENLDLPSEDRKGRRVPEGGRAEFWFDQICQGFPFPDAYGSFVKEALRQYAQGETDAVRKEREKAAARKAKEEAAARKAKEEEERRVANSPFAVLAALKCGR